VAEQAKLTSSISITRPKHPVADGETVRARVEVTITNPGVPAIDVPAMSITLGNGVSYVDGSAEGVRQQPMSTKTLTGARLAFPAGSLKVPAQDSVTFSFEISIAQQAVAFQTIALADAETDEVVLKGFSTVLGLPARPTVLPQMVTIPLGGSHTFQIETLTSDSIISYDVTSGPDEGTLDLSGIDDGIVVYHAGDAPAGHYIMNIAAYDTYGQGGSSYLKVIVDKNAKPSPTPTPSPSLSPTPTPQPTPTAPETTASVTPTPQPATPAPTTVTPPSPSPTAETNEPIVAALLPETETVTEEDDSATVSIAATLTNPNDVPVPAPDIDIVIPAGAELAEGSVTGINDPEVKGTRLLFSTLGASLPPKGELSFGFDLIVPVEDIADFATVSLLGNQSRDITPVTVVVPEPQIIAPPPAPEPEPQPEPEPEPAPAPEPLPEPEPTHQPTAPTSAPNPDDGDLISIPDSITDFFPNGIPAVNEVPDAIAPTSALPGPTSGPQVGPDPTASTPPTPSPTDPTVAATQSTAATASQTAKADPTTEVTPVPDTADSTKEGIGPLIAGFRQAADGRDHRHTALNGGQCAIDAGKWLAAFANRLRVGAKSLRVPVVIVTFGGDIDTVSRAYVTAHLHGEGAITAAAHGCHTLVARGHRIACPCRTTGWGDFVESATGGGQIADET
jgi:hypothetical protein